MNKKAQGLPMNTVVIAILVIVVLVLVIAFFFGGFTSLTTKISEVFYGSLAGTTKTLAIQQCNQYCSQLELQGADSGVGSAFCRKRGVDLNEDGKIDDATENINCVNTNLGVSCRYTKGDTSITIDCQKK